MVTNTLGFSTPEEIAVAKDLVVFTRLFQTFCLNPGVHRLLGSRIFWPARLTTAVAGGRPL